MISMRIADGASADFKRDRVVLLLHGLCSTALEVRLFARLLRAHGFDVVVPDIAGYSPDEPWGPRRPESRCDDWVRSVVAEVDRLRLLYEEVNLCGVSVGATLALAAAAVRNTSIGALSLISTAIFFDGWSLPRLRFLLPLVCRTPLRRLYRYREHAPFGVKNLRVRAWIERRVDDVRRASIDGSTIPTTRLREADRLMRQVRRCLSAVRVPTLMIHAREDDIASLANLRYVELHIGTSMFFRAIVTDSYHLITLDNDRDVAAFKTVQFFNTVSRMWRTGPRSSDVHSPYTPPLN